MKWTASIAGLILTLGLMWLMAHRIASLNEPDQGNRQARMVGQNVEPPNEIDRLLSPRSHGDNAATEFLIAIEAESDPERRGELLDTAAELVPESGLPETLNALMRLNSPEAAELRELLVRRWTQRAPRVAAEWAGGLREGESSVEALQQVSVAWANVDLQATVAWTKSLPETSGKASAILAVSYEAARVEPLTSMELAISLPPSSERDKLLIHAVSQWVELDAAAAMAWTQAVPDPELRQQLLVAELVATAKQDAADAASAAVSLLKPGEDQNRAVVAIVQRWAENDPQAAAEWVRRLSNPEVQKVAMQNLVAVSTVRDASGTSP